MHIGSGKSWPWWNCKPEEVKADAKILSTIISMCYLLLGGLCTHKSVKVMEMLLYNILVQLATNICVCYKITNIILLCCIIMVPVFCLFLYRGKKNRLLIKNTYKRCYASYISHIIQLPSVKRENQMTLWEMPIIGNGKMMS